MSACLMPHAPNENRLNRGSRKAPAAPISQTLEIGPLRNTRRNIIKMLGVGFVSMVLGGDVPQPETPSNHPVLNVNENASAPLSDEVITDRVIAEIENGVDTLYVLVSPKINELAPSPLKTALGIPFKVMKENLKNPGKNFFTFRDELKRKGTMIFTPTNRYFFSYLVNDDMQEGTVAAYSPNQGIMMVRSELDSSNLLDMSLVYHEVWHADFAVSMSPKKRALLATPPKGQKGKLLINEEGAAWELQLELIDLILDNALSKPGSTITVDDMMQRLKARPDQRNLIQQILHFAGIYFKKPMGQRTMQRELLDEIARIYESTGEVEMYAETAPDTFVRYLPRR